MVILDMQIKDQVSKREYFGEGGGYLSPISFPMYATAQIFQS